MTKAKWRVDCIQVKVEVTLLSHALLANSVFISRMQLQQSTLHFRQGTGVENVRDY